MSGGYRPDSWVGLLSMWPGFSLGVAGWRWGHRVHQVQLIQPSLALRFAVPVLGDALDPVTAGFSLAVIAVVFVSHRLSVGQPQKC